jgi:16S rRNA (adenine1518-N6/adenine1519-N6)-dimethyltransferase
LAEKAKKVIAIEKDGRMAEYLEKALGEKNVQNVEIIKGDILKMLADKTNPVFSSLPSNYKVIANIPYYLTSRLIRLLLEKEVLPEMVILMIQKEVAERICSKTGNSILSISIAYYAEPKIRHIVSKNCFHPKPKIDSAIISITPKRQKLEKKFTSVFFKILKTGFSSPRKQLLKNLSELGDREVMRGIIEKSGLKTEQRAETLSLEDWKTLTINYLKK